MSDLTPTVAQDASPPGRWDWRVRVGVWVWAAVCTMLLFAVAMTRTATYDEDQYIAAGVMARHGLPYRDFLYLQAPLYPLVLAPVFALTGGWFLLAGRVVTFVLSVGSGGLLWRIVRQLGAGPGLAMVLVTACLASPFLASPLANTRNDILPVFLMLAGLAVHLWAVERSWWGRVLAAVLFGLAAEAKVLYLFAPVCLGVQSLFAPRQRVPPFVLGMVVAGLPALVCGLASPEGFWFGVVRYHLAAPRDWYKRAGLGELLTPGARMGAVADWMTFGGNLTLLVLVVALSLLAIARHRKWKRPGRLLLGLTIGAAGMGFVPSPSWAMYFAAVAPLLACCVAHLDRTTTYLAGAARKNVLVAVAALPIVPVVLLQLPEVARLGDLGLWAGVAAHRRAVEIRAALPAGGDVATLFPMGVLDANPVRAAFATGPFVFRSGEVFGPDQLARLHALSPGMLERAFNEAPPGAIYAGLYADAWKLPMDAALTAYAEGHHWRLVRTDADGGKLWVPP